MLTTKLPSQWSMSGSLLPALDTSISNTLQYKSGEQLVTLNYITSLVPSTQVIKLQKPLDGLSTPITSIDQWATIIPSSFLSIFFPPLYYSLLSHSMFYNPWNSQPWIQGGCCCTRVQWVMVGNISHKCGHVWSCLPMVCAMVNTFMSMCIELYLLPAVWSRSSTLTLTTAKPRWSPF
jgi:hypothetical protein